MSAFEWIVLAFQYLVLAYFTVLNLLYALFGYIGLRSIVRYSRELSQVALKDLLEREVYQPVSILVPAFNEQESIVASVSSFLGLQYPEFEVIVTNDGSTDATMERMISAFGLVEEERVFRRVVDCQTMHRVLRSKRYPNLVVIDKVNGGRSDALNASLNFARFPLICAVDADSMLDAEAVLRASRLFVEDPTLVAVGGTVRPMNGSEVVDGRIKEPRLPKRWIERIQILEYARAFFTGRAGWSRLGGLLIISGAFGLFHRQSVVELGGFSTETITEDMEIVVRMHKEFRRQGREYKILFIPDPICWTEVPSDMKSLRTQRNRWHRGLWEVLWMHRTMFFNPRYKQLGMVSVPYFWFFEALSPVIETSGYAFILIAWIFGFLNVEFAILFATLAFLYGMLLSQLAVGIETFLLARFPRFRDRVALFAAAFVEMLGFRQIISIERMIATFQVMRKRGQWGAMKRTGIAEKTAEATAEPETRAA